MTSLFEHLGINWKLLIAQGVNFFALVLLLNYFLYKPLVRLLNERRGKIEKGLSDAAVAEDKLKEIDVLRQEEVLKGRKDALVLVEDAKKSGQDERQKIIERAETDAEEMRRKTEEMRQRLIQREMKNLEDRSREIVTAAILSSVNLHPSEVDEKLINDAVAVMGVKKKQHAI